MEVSTKRLEQESHSPQSDPQSRGDWISQVERPRSSQPTETSVVDEDLMEDEDLQATLDV